MKKKIIIILVIIISCFAFWLLIKGILWYQARASERAILKVQNQAIENILDTRQIKSSEENTINPFGDDGIVKIFLMIQKTLLNIWSKRLVP